MKRKKRKARSKKGRKRKPEVTGLGFPVRDVADLEKSYCFGLQPWDPEGLGEIHGGVDLAARYSPTSPSIGRVPIVAPADARVERIIESVSGAGAATLVVVLKMNKYWYLVCNFEPQTTDPAIFEEQRRSITVRERQRIRRAGSSDLSVFLCARPIMLTQRSRYAEAQHPCSQARYQA